MSARCWAVIPAAGSGSRMGLGYNKALMPIGGRAMARVTCDRLMASGRFEGAVVVAGRDDADALKRAFEGADYRVAFAMGGETRQASVLNGLRALPEGVNFAAVHDAARPFVSDEIINAVVDSALSAGSGVACTPVTDTIKRVSGGRVTTPPRAELRAVQTPQVFRLDELISALEMCARENIAVTDEAQAIEIAGGNPVLVETREGAKNRKVTYMSDISQTAPKMRVGFGYDAHRLTQGRKLVLCGVEIDYDRGLLGHSDADAATHALIDALLGAAALGDIGALYPDTDPSYSGVYSIELLRDTAARLRAAGYEIGNCDITIVAQRPKLRPYIDRMTATLAQALAIEPARVSVKATTTERMGFEGREEGISASAVAAVYGTAGGAQ